MLKAICACLATALLAVPAAVQASPVAHAAAACGISGKERKLGATYVTSLTTRHVSCSKAISFVKAFHKCRRKHGPAGKCSRLQGYTCTEKRESIATQYDSRATCSSGSRNIVQVYTQNT